MWWIVLGILCAGVSIALIFNTSYKIRFNPFFAYQNRFSAELPNVEVYGGQQKSAIIATEYPHRQPLHLASIALDYQPNPHLVCSDALPLLITLQAALPKRYFICCELNLAALVTTQDAAALARLQHYQVDFAIYDLKQQQWLGCVLFQSQTDLSTQLKLKFVRATLLHIKLPVLVLPKLKKYKLPILKKLLIQNFKVN